MCPDSTLKKEHTLKKEEVTTQLLYPQLAVEKARAPFSSITKKERKRTGGPPSRSAPPEKNRVQEGGKIHFHAKTAGASCVAKKKNAANSQLEKKRRKGSY